MAMQIGQFVKTKELKQELEAMDGYDDANWEILRPAMMELWGERDNTILHNQQDLIDLSNKISKKGGLTTVQEYKTYLGKFSAILQYLIKNKQLRAKEDASYQFLLAFSPTSQKNIKRVLVTQKQLPKGPDGSSKLPKWEHVLVAAKAKIRVEEPGFSNISGFAESNQVMQKALDAQKGDGRRREKMVEEIPNQAALQKKIVDMEKEIASLKNQRANNAPVNYQQQANNPNNEFSRGDPKPGAKLAPTGTRICYYCHREGHRTFGCPEAIKDEHQGLKPPVMAALQTDHPSVFQIQQEEPEASEMTSAVNQIDWDPPTLGKANFERVKMEANAATTRAEALRGQRKVQREETAMDVDHDEPTEEVIKEVPAVRRPPGRILDKPRAKKDKQSAKSALLTELDNLKIPTTFSQLTAISPTYVEELINKLQDRVTGPKNTKLSYIKTVKSKSHKVAGAMVNQEDKEEKDFNCFYSCALGYIEARIMDQRVPFMVDSGSMVNVIPAKLAIDLELEVVKVDIPMRGYTFSSHRKLKSAS
ncbi:hypothetical protein PCANC_10710 [Puccinia coronata f. sp. avenae]|uniref:CCHC-type domain-containing protein n=1 Tax=Puccinia coronata f. sp. avenae TaxID=200324 RepID=A0A2N5VG21_9BASI|nr:hypothetical protein PCANC_10710 [Puccinia coronata f. sp. avenae]